MGTTSGLVGGPARGRVASAGRPLAALGVLAVLAIGRWYVPAPTAGAVIASSVLVSLLALVTGALIAAPEHPFLRQVPPTRSLNALLGGVVVGAGAVSVASGLLVASSTYRRGLEPSPPLSIIAALAAFALATAVIEEVAFRGVLFSLVDRIGGPLVALATTSIAFGLVHVFNPASSPWACVALALGPGLLFGALVVRTRRLLSAVAAHAAWNGTQILTGGPVSGIRLPGLAVVEVSGPVLLTGGAFGIEGSVVLVATSALASFLLLRSPGGAWRGLRRASGARLGSSG
ncbi:hypothetical protein CLV49_0356 [Labedella gwakjiensis]|uniref:CAAX prenyl protease 2/Lysostaphin resistance protein A-like domain-containing protein n=1 Tax=Labedella gwakjiensis TaxID=390269 RepID=A0A2P8GS17_9MICO|nr:CPBP family intramembrane glutamic endopeptidase [Labedella gwakjiensis]PSL36758.1 hypothetical protein CLV49_0356 [Labedella gwakjiensis]